MCIVPYVTKLIQSTAKDRTVQICTILWFSFCRFTIEKSSILQCRRLLPVAITNENIIFLSVTELKNNVFLDLVLLSCTPVATNSFWSSYTATLSSKCFWIFLPSGIQSGEETDVGRQRLNRQRLPKLEIWASASIVYCLLFCLPFNNYSLKSR